MIWKKIWRENGWKFLGIFLLLEMNLAASILFYPDFKKNFEMLASLAFAKIPVLQDLLQMTGAGGYPGYLLVQHFFKALNVLGSVAAVLLGMGAIAKEVENRTIEILLSRPIARSKILLAHFALGAGFLVLLVFLSTASMLPLSRLIEIEGEEIPVATLFLCASHSSLFLILLFTATLLLSCISSDQAKVAFVAAGFFLAMFLVYFVKTVNVFSLYKWNDLALFLEIHKTSALPWGKDALLAAAICVLLGISVKVLNRRDF